MRVWGEKSRNWCRRLILNITVGSLDEDDIYSVFYDETKRRLFQVVPDGMDYAMRLVEDLGTRKQLLTEKGILTNPYNFTDI